MKILGISPIVPSVLCAKEKLPFKPNKAQREILTTTLTDKEISRMCNTINEPAIWSTWSTMDSVGMCRLEKGKWVNVVIKVTDSGNNQNVTIV